MGISKGEDVGGFILTVDILRKPLPQTLNSKALPGA